MGWECCAIHVSVKWSKYTCAWSRVAWNFDNSPPLLHVTPKPVLKWNVYNSSFGPIYIYVIILCMWLIWCISSGMADQPKSCCVVYNTYFIISCCFADPISSQLSSHCLPWLTTSKQSKYRTHLEFNNSSIRSSSRHIQYRNCHGYGPNTGEKWPSGLFFPRG